MKINIQYLTLLCDVDFKTTLLYYYQTSQYLHYIIPTIIVTLKYDIHGHHSLLSYWLFFTYLIVIIQI